MPEVSIFHKIQKFINLWFGGRPAVIGLKLIVTGSDVTSSVIGLKPFVTSPDVRSTVIGPPLFITGLNLCIRNSRCRFR